VYILPYLRKPMFMAFSLAIISFNSFGLENPPEVQAVEKVSLLETVLVTADRQQTQLGDIAASISAVSTEELNTIQHVHINEALARVPGTWISRGNGQENLTAIRSPVLTGAGSCGAFQFSLDSIPLRAAGLCNVNQLFEANSEQAQSIEVIRGPSSVLYGANAIHGSINVISANSLPGLFNQQKTDNRQGSISLDAGPHGYGRIKTSGAQVSGHHGLQINVNGSHDDGYLDDSGYDQQKMDVIHQYQTNKINITSVLNISNLNQETAGYLEGKDAYKDSALKTTNGNPEAYRDASSARLHSRIEWTDGHNNWSVTPYFRDTEMEFLMHFLPGQPLEENGQQSFGLQTSHRYLGLKSFDILSGVDLEKSTGYLRQTQASALNGSNDFLNATLPAGKQYDFDVDVMLISPFSQLKYSIDEANTLSLGLRLESLDYNYVNNMISGRTQEDGTACGFGGCRYSRPDDRSDTFENISSTIGWIHNFDQNSQSFANISHAFRAPQATELYRLQADQLVADLKSEKVNNLELGYRASYDQINYTVSAYYMEKENVIFQNSDRENMDNGQTSHTGLELSTGLQLSEQLYFNLSASYGDHRYTKNIDSALIDGNQIDTSPKFIGNAQLGWAISPKQHLELEWIHLGKYYTDEANLNEYPGHDLLNLRYLLNMTGNWHASARITNLLDSDYAERADFSGFVGDRYFVGEPLSLYVSVGANF
jgi:iron complex outermembrane receptor protein